jgi:NADPH2:quinone reductase
VHAGAGGVGQLLIQLAKRRGAFVIATVGSEEKAAIARERGASHVILYRDVDFRDEVRRITNGRGVDVVYDAVGKDTILRSVGSLARRGMCVNYGGASGHVASIEPLALAEAGSVYFTRPHLADYISTASELRGRAGDVFAAYARKELLVAIDRELPLERAGDAHEAIESRRTKGKLLLRITD